MTSQTTPSTVLVVGAGIGGLTAAIALRRAGMDVLVLEQATELREVGAGISLWPNAINTLRRLGLGDAVESAGRAVTETHTRSWRGALLHSSPVDHMESRFGAPLVMIHRAALHTALCDALGDGVRLGSRCVGLEQDDDHVRLRLADRSKVTGRVAIGADGLHSIVRAMTLADGPPRFRGVRSWRSVVTVSPSIAEHLSPGEWWGRGSVFGAQRLPGNQVYWYAAARVARNSSSARATVKDDLLHRFGGWQQPVPQLLEATEDSEILRNDLFDRSPSDSMAFGRVALLGDAVHPMLPYLGQGACQAIEDGETVAEALTGALDPHGLELYSRRRVARVADAVVQSRRMFQVAHVRNPVALGLRRVLLRRASPEATLSRLAPLVGGVPTPVDVPTSEARS